MSRIDEVLHDVQAGLKVPKSEWNDFSKYRYRTAEGILQAVKPLLPAGYAITTPCEPVEMAGRLVVRCEAVLGGADGERRASAYAVEPESKKGMDSAQISGSCISYAKKYALANLLAIDDTADSDVLDGKSPQAGAETAEEAAGPSDERARNAAKRRLWRAVGAWAEATGNDARKAYIEVFAERPPQRWDPAEIEAKAVEFEEATS